jgi:hypothetical protein
MSIDPCYDVTAARRNGNYGIVEICDGRKEDAWRRPQYDDSGWQEPILLRDHRSGRAMPNVSPWTAMIPRGVEQCAEDEVLPQAVTLVGEVENQEFQSSMELPWYLALDVPQELDYAEVEGVENLLDPDAGPMVIRQPSPLDRSQAHQRCATVILDFGRELDAFGRIDVEGNEGAVIDVAYGERLIGGRVQPVVQGTGYADRYILRGGRQQHEVYDWKGYRYVQLTFRELTEPLKVHAVTANYFRYPLEPRGAFNCSDEKLARIWDVGAYTQQLCTTDAMMDTPWREQQQWLGDGRVQLLILQNAFGEHNMARKFVEQFAEGQDETGMIPCVSMRPGYYITDYSLWWVQAVLDVLTFDGDEEFAARFLPNIQLLFDWFAPHENPQGLLEDVPGWTFIDWANVGKEGVSAALNATYYIALGAATAIAYRTGRDDLAGQWAARGRKIKDAWHRTFWCDDRELYVDNVVEGEQTDRFSQHTQAIAVVAGLSAVDGRPLMQRTVDDDSLVQTEPYFSFYLVEALGQVGLAEQAARFIRQRWGDMLDAGATSFWEEWQVTGTFRGGRWLARPRSHCHAWSAAPTAWLSRYVLGVRRESVDGPVIVEPQPCGLDSARGRVPVGDEEVEIVWQVQDGELQVDVSAPRGLELDCREPAGWEGHTRFSTAV